MAKARTWLWVLIGLALTFVLGIVAVAGTGIYFVSHHFNSKTTTTAAATQSMDDVRAGFKGQTPLMRLDAVDRPVVETHLETLSTSATKPSDLVILVWDPDKEQLVNISVPFWLLRFARRKALFSTDDRNMNYFNDLNLDVAELERVGPVLVLDQTTQRGNRVLIWTR
jgi:hypothetical protein